MCRIKEQLGEYVQGKIQEIAEHSQCTKVGLFPSIIKCSCLGMHQLSLCRGSVCHLNLHAQRYCSITRQSLSSCATCRIQPSAS